MRSGELSGVVLVGGRSRRMGRDKARLVVAGEPLWQRQVRVLERSGADPVGLALRPRQRSFGEKHREIRDTTVDAGPLGGLYTALALSPTPWLAVLAVDMPQVDPGWFRRLRRSCRPGMGAVYFTAAGYEPLAAIYPREALPLVEKSLRAGKFTLQQLVAGLIRQRRLVAVPLPARQAWRAANWNTPRGPVDSSRRSE